MNCPRPDYAALRNRLLPVTCLGLVIGVVVAGTSSVAAQPDPGRFEAACGSGNPFFVTTCYAQGLQPDDPALVAFHDTPDDSDHIVLATQGQIGSAYGVAYRPSEPALYVGAYQKRGTAFGPGGPGMIYRVDMTSGAVEQWLALPNPGADVHDSSDNYWPDTPARNRAGVMSLGDLDVSDDGTLYVMHLLENKIFRYRVSDKADLGALDIGSVNEPWANQARGFGLKVWNGKLYHGVVRTAFQSQDDDDLEALVYETDLDGSNVRQVLRFNLIYDRGDVFGNASAQWKPWKDGYNSVAGGAIGAYPQPMLTDIEFADNGDMILGFRDRNGDMTFFNPGGRNPPGEGTGIPAGDILMARRNGDTWDITPSPEFFDEDFGPNRGGSQGAHDETGFGGLARKLNENVVVQTGLAPLRISSGGGFWFSMDSGDDLGREELYNFESEVNFGKANGLGDIELLCGPEQATETPTATSTVTATITPTLTSTATATVTSSSTAPAPTSTNTNTATVVPSSTATATTAPSITPSVTTTTGSTPDAPEERDTPSPPQPTPILPGLPQTGFGSSPRDLGMLGALGAVGCALAVLVYRRRRLTTS